MKMMMMLIKTNKKKTNYAHTMHIVIQIMM